MDATVIGLMGLVILIVLLGMGIHIAFAMGIVGIIGCALIFGFERTMAGIIQLSPYSSATSATLTCIPLFILMGNLAMHTGISTGLFNAATKWLGRLPSGVGIATIVACAWFAGITGSSIACTATIGALAIPAMRQNGYDPKFACGCVAAGGTLGILIPPSNSFIVYGYLTETPVSKLFMAGILPGVLSVGLFVVAMIVVSKISPGTTPAVKKNIPWEEKFSSLKEALPMVAIFIFMVVGLGNGLFDAIQAGSIGVFSVIVVSMIMRKLSTKSMKLALLDAGKTTAMIMAIMICAMVFGRFMAISRMQDALVQALSNFGAIQLIVGIMISYLILGCFMDNLAIHVLTIPLLWPVLEGLGVDPYWFGVLVVKLTEIALITPPVGYNCYVISGMVKDVPLHDVFKGIIPFLIAEVTTTTLLLVFPQISTFIPSIMK